MSENKKDKDSYAKDTLAFQVPPELRANPQRKHPQGQPNPQRRYIKEQQNFQGQYNQEQMNYQRQYSQEQMNPQRQYDQEQMNYQRQYSQEQMNPQRQYNQEQMNYQRQYSQEQMNPQRQYNQEQPNPQRQHNQGQLNPQRPHNQGQSNPKRPHSQGQQNPQRQRTQKKTNSQRQHQQIQGNQSRQKPVKRNKVKRRHKAGCLTKITFSLLGLLLFLFIIYSVISLSLINKVDIIDKGARIENTHALYSSSSVRNVLLIGTDSRGSDRGRSDSMILLSINSKTDKISLVSFMRDSYVQIPGYGGDRLNAAYSYGGPELLMDTIEENFYIEIDDYFTVNFISFANIVDAVGGVEIEVTDAEADAINVLLDSKEGNTLFGKPDESDYLHGGGKYKLTGKQALCYSRLRYVGNADFERTERQRKVLTEIIKSAGTTNPFKLGNAAKNVLPSMETNMSKMSMYLLSLRIPSFIIGYDFEQLRVPADGTYSDGQIDGKSVLDVDIDANLNIIENELY